jgi:hypothetical protein
MAVIGNPNLWANTFPDDLIPKILDLVVSAWKTFIKPAHDENEVNITSKFRSSLINLKDFRQLPVTIQREIPEDDLQTGKERGRIDLRFTHGYREDIYFAFECKRLNKIDSKNKINSLAPEYVKEGMMRFVIGKYASSVDKGGMIGYVMNGNTDTAIRAVNRNINNNKESLKISNPNALCSSSLRPDSLEIKETKHELDNRNFMIYHIFLAC